MVTVRAPSLSHERRYWEAGAETVVGMDEVGRGSWAGPLTIVAAAVPKDRRVYRVRDSKQLTARQREALFDRVASWCTWGVGEASPAECDALGMSAAQRLAAQRALAALGRPVDVVLADGKWDFVSTPDSRYRTQMIVKGDRISLSIAAASVLAKVTRDRQMRLAAEHYPQYHFDSNKGYPCPRHIMALNGYGASAIHRTSWAFMGNLPWSCGLREEPELVQERLFPGV